MDLPSNKSGIHSINTRLLPLNLHLFTITIMPLFIIIIIIIIPPNLYK